VDAHQRTPDTDKGVKMTDKPTSTPQPVKLLHSLNDVTTRTSLGMTTVRELIRTGQLDTVKIGGRRLVSEDALRAFVDKLQGGEAS
jgi:excisionase family DNA binding protein